MPATARFLSGGALGIVVAVSMPSAGCTGSATIHLVSLQASAIDPPAAKVWRYHARECYWWVDEAGELNIAMKCRQQNLLMGKLGLVDLEMSWVLGEPPAGRARNYSIRDRETRTILITAVQDHRFRSYAGIVSVVKRPGEKIQGSFRIWMRHRPGLSLFSFIPQRPGNILFFGTFEAVPDRLRGRVIRARCESGGWTRPIRKKPAAPTTRPSALSRSTRERDGVSQ